MTSLRDAQQKRRLLLVWIRLAQLELNPFQRVIRNGLSGVLHRVRLALLKVHGCVDRCGGPWICFMLQLSKVWTYKRTCTFERTTQISTDPSTRLGVLLLPPSTQQQKESDLPGSNRRPQDNYIDSCQAKGQMGIIALSSISYLYGTSLPHVDVRVETMPFI
ncbi:hypothetical protein B0H34DRAFT_485610 [Crassisporium funariophilum]|nr:hypothetical protein B0H34DRAFT_485610 [Crassisporium funariophilum]